MSIFIEDMCVSNEARLWSNDYINKKICRKWSADNPQTVHESPFHLLKLTVWCGLNANVIVGRYFFRNEEGAAVTVNGKPCSLIFFFQKSVSYTSTTFDSNKTQHT